MELGGKKSHSQHIPSNKTQLASYWEANCRGIIRRSKRLHKELKRPEKAKPKDQFLHMAGLAGAFVKKESLTQPFFIQKSPPREYDDLFFSPEKAATVPKSKQVLEPISLTYVFGYHSVKSKKILYSS